MLAPWRHQEGTVKSPDSSGQSSPLTVFRSVPACYPPMETKAATCQHTRPGLTDLHSSRGAGRAMAGAQSHPLSFPRSRREEDHAHQQASWAGAWGRSCCLAQARQQRRPRGPLERPGCSWSRAWRPGQRLAWTAWPSSREPLSLQQADSGKVGIRAARQQQPQQVLPQGAPQMHNQNTGPVGLAATDRKYVWCQDPSPPGNGHTGP